MAKARTLDDMPADDLRKRAVSDPVWRMLTGAFAFAAGVFICGSVGSYEPADPSWNAATSTIAQNLFGPAGAVFSDVARQIFGWSAWIGGLAAMIGGAMRAVLIGQPRLTRWFTGLAVVPLSAACFAAWPVPASWPLSAGLGGIAGDGLLHTFTIPFKALLLPVPELIAGLVMGLLALWAASSALGFGKRDAWLLQTAAAREGLRAVRGAGSWCLASKPPLSGAGPNVTIASLWTAMSIMRQMKLILAMPDIHTRTRRFFSQLLRPRHALRRTCQKTCQSPARSGARLCLHRARVCTREGGHRAPHCRQSICSSSHHHAMLR